MKRHAVSFTIAATLCLSTHIEAAAALKGTRPTEVCNFLADMGLRGGTWKNQAGVFGCLSAYKQVGAGSPLPNTIAYYVDGTAAAATQAKLVLNVNNRATARAAHGELLKAAESLSVKATGQPLTPALKDAIQQGKKASTKLGMSTVEITRDDWPTGKGYEVAVKIR